MPHHLRLRSLRTYMSNAEAEVFGFPETCKTVSATVDMKDTRAIARLLSGILLLCFWFLEP